MIDWKYVVVLIVLIGAVILTAKFKDEIIKYATCFFKLENINYWAGGFGALIMLVRKIKTREIDFRSTMSFDEFRKRVETVMSFVSSPITLVGSVSLAKGLFFQYFYDIPYFPNFDNLELLFVLLVALYLAFTSVLGILRDIKDILLVSSFGAGKPTAIPAKEVTKEAPDPTD